MIEWGKLSKFGGDPRRSFEELCYQVACELYGEDSLTRVEGSGGDQGLEFYRTLKNGTSGDGR